MRLAAGFLLATLIAAAPAYAERRALLIANSAYQHLTPLQTPKANVDALAAALSKVHFEPQFAYDLSQADMVAAVQGFMDTVQAGDFVLVYFSGYGYQVDKLNYLLPVGFDPRDKSPLGMKALSVRNLQTLLEQRKAGTRMLLLDACRRGTGLPQGLAPMDPASNTLVAFSAAPNHSAPDPPNGGPNPFTAALVNAIESLGSTPLSVLDRVRNDVARISPGQVPFVTRASVEDFVFTERLAPPISLSQEGGAGPPVGSVAAIPEAPSSDPKAGDVKVNTKDGLRYVWIPPGTFQMGCSSGDGECYGDENPAHEVRISRGFWMGQTEITQEACQRVMGTNRSQFKGAKLPVENISWNDARGYCQAVDMRLPTEAEWEYAARAGSSESRYGDLGGIAWHSANSERKTHEVGGKQANPWGLHDMLGNVWEWVADWYADRYPPGSATDPQGPESGTKRAMRGGAWVSNPRAARASVRGRLAPTYRGFDFGVRCAGNIESMAKAPEARVESSGNSPAPDEKAIPPTTEALKALPAGATKVNAKDGLTYVWIPPGTFQMGCSPGDGECWDFERPAHQVTISSGFWMGQTEVTQEAYQQVMGRNPSYFKGAKLPVEETSWNDARSYCQEAGMRLPTEAEWEYAARAGSRGSRYGDLNGIAWYNGNSGGTTHEVGGKQANAWGLHDMLGNVWEWVADWYADQYPPGNATDPLGPASGTWRTLRGGAWGDYSRSARASLRFRYEPAFHIYGVGVRCAGVGDSAASKEVAVKPPVTPVETVPTVPSSAPKAGDVKVNPKDGLRYVWIPPGTFQMGCSPGDTECSNPERPAHQVEISAGFWMGQTDVTVGAWKRYAKGTGGSMPPEPKHVDRALNVSWTEQQVPMTMITWTTAAAYCRWTGGRLPTEAEWEYAARAGNVTARYGNLDEIAWYADNSGSQRIDSTALALQGDPKEYENQLTANGNGPKPVSLKRPNAWNLYDTLGNVWQWTADWYGATYYDQAEPRDPHGAPGGNARVLRGGSWYDDPHYVRVSLRSRNRPGSQNPSTGCRCVLARESLVGGSGTDRLKAEPDNGKR